MEGCLLCLELKKESAEAIVINSNQWNELNVNNVLSKYLWNMDHVGTSSWICSTCWRAVYEFHKFYLRIEKIHREFGLTSNIKQVEEFSTFVEQNLDVQIHDDFQNELEPNSQLTPVEELKDFLCEYNLSDDNFQSQLIAEDYKTLIKSELHEEILKDSNPLDIFCETNCSVNATDKALKSSPVKTRLNTKRKIKRVAKKSNTRAIKAIKKEKNSESNDSERELDNVENKRSNNSNHPPKINHNEKDKFLSENFKINCYLCNVPFDTFFYMRKHFDENHTERGHVKCCNKKFYRRSILVDHVNFHLNPDYFKCNQCGKVMADRRCLELHSEIHEPNHEKSHCCDICGKGFVKLGVLKKHRMIHLSDEEKRFSCPDCSKNFASNYLLSSHYRSVHLKKYAKICDICGKSIRSKDVFERHMLQHEGKPAPSVNCDVCGLVLTDKKALKRHKETIHPAGGQHEYTCSICSKTSPNLRALKRHVQYKHVMGYDHKCTICDKAFKRAPTLKEHMASHTGTTLYTCPWCPRTFNSNANMHSHRKKIHPKEWEEASRKRYSGNLPPNYKPPVITESNDLGVPFDM